MPISDFFDIEDETFEDTKQQFLAHMDALQNKSVREYIIHKKYQEINTHYRKWYSKALVAKTKIWRPKNIHNIEQTINELRSLNPRLRFVEKSSRLDIDLWTSIRIFLSSAEFDQNPGRFLRFFLEAEDGRILGITSIGSDVMNLGVRDRWIGWTEEQKEKGMLNHTAIGTTIVPTQPFGYNFLGGKLLASMLATKYVQEVWEREYGDVLVGLTTTSLYGDGSMYNGIKWWRSLGESTGKVSLKPDDDVYDKLHAHIKKAKSDEYDSIMIDRASGPSTGVKQKIMNMIYKEVGITTTRYQHGFRRGVYFCPLFENTREFLCEQIDRSQLIPKINLARDRDEVLEWWLPKAEKRFLSLSQDGRIKDDVLFYVDAINLSYDEFQQKYIEQVGR